MNKDEIKSLTIGIILSIIALELINYLIETLQVNIMKTFNTVRMNNTIKSTAVAAYLDGESAYALSKSYGVSSGTIKRWVKAAGFNTRNRSEAFLVSDLQRAKMLSK